MAEMMDKDIRMLRSMAISPILKNSKHKSFFTQQEFEANRGKIDIINNACDNLIVKLKQ